MYDVRCTMNTNNRCAENVHANCGGRYDGDDDDDVTDGETDGLLLFVTP